MKVYLIIVVGMSYKRHCSVYAIYYSLFVDGTGGPRDLFLLVFFHCDSIFLGVLHFIYDYVYLLLRSNKSYTTFALHLHIRLLNLYFL